MRAFYQILEKAKVERVRLYDLRHTYASLMLNAGVPLPYVSTQMGHAKQTTTLNYYSKWMASSMQPAYLRWQLEQEKNKSQNSTQENLYGTDASRRGTNPNDYLDVLDEKYTIFQ